MSSMNGTSALRVNVALLERDVVKLILDFFQQRELYISMLDIERETGIINGSFSEDILFLRQLILDGQWDDVIDFVQPLKSIDAFDAKQFIYIVLKYQFLELLCLKTEAQIENDLSVEQIVKFLNDLRPFAPNEQEYKKLSFLLTLKRLQDHTDYHNWNPSAGRVQCFQEIFPLIHRFLQVEKQTIPIAQGDRLVQLLIKGLLYESCVEHCQARATSTEETIDLTDPNSLLAITRLSDTDVSLLSWLHALPTETFSCPFEQKTLTLNIDKFQKPILEATWAEHVLSTPFKPQTMFPFNATPTGKPRSTELMSRSLAPQYDGLSYGLIRSQIFGDYNRSFVNDMSRSLAICNLKDNGNNNIHNTSATATILPTVEEVLYEETPPPSTPSPPSLPRTLSPAANIISPQSTHRSQSPKRSITEPHFTNNNLPSYDTIGQQPQHYVTSPKSLSRSSQSSSSQKSKHTNGSIVKENENLSPINHTQISLNNMNTSPVDTSNGLLKEYQKSRAEIIRQFDEHETRRNELQKQLSTASTTPNPKIRAIIDVTKYDSLEDIARSPAFIPIASIEDVQAIRAIDIHPTGKYFAVGSNSKMVRVCAYPDTKNVRTDSVPKQAKVLFKKAKHHLGSIYCMAWSPSGRIIATGSNDKLIKLIRLNMDRLEEETNHTEIELTHHNGTIRDVIFMHDSLKDDSILLSGGAGDCKVYVTDVKKQTTIKSYSGHEGHIYSLFTWDACSFVSGSQDGTSRLWDIRQPECVHVIPPRPSNSAVAAVTVDCSGQLLAAGYEDASCLLYDLRGKRVVQAYQPHSNEVRSVRFSVNSYYLLTASYDKKVVMTSLSGDLTKPLVLSNVAAHTDKIIQARWHPNEISFATTSADRSCIIWAPPLSALSALTQSP
ncbi:unnamed protein product [Adineta steineri]|uniref:CTLH domain-containing protein n=1 Tax=Adineta steineri TaxID=433720 RepID=A0A814B7X9_9BILA|nr:unnamed protein product [Adineta steineri]CAF0923317.1 unnamed protein product [Adineta steineri]